MKLLVANRGEIAVRVIRACREMGIRSVAVYSDCDRDALHVRLADEAHHIGASPAIDSYLRIDRLIDVARAAAVDLVHPGYGFLAENEDFARACLTAGLLFVGPGPDAIRRLGDKSEARKVAAEVGVPTVPGTKTAFPDDAADVEIGRAADVVGFPVVVKAVAGGGGKGMRTVASPDELPAAVRLARSEAKAAFGDGTIYLERRLESPRHIEIQLLADEHGTVVPFVERECSIQRRHQKVVEESPSTVIDPKTREAMADAAARLARHAGYTNAGTVEFLVDSRGQFYFLEVNTRLQVEHPVTEVVTGVDLVQWQIRVALGERLTIPPAYALVPRAHAIECRIYAEDPDLGFRPSPGLVRGLDLPAGPFVRNDCGVVPGFEIPIFYDSMISKLVVWGADRAGAIGRLTRALDECRIVGVNTTLPFFRWLVGQPDFIEGRFSTTYLDSVLAARAGEPFVPLTTADERDATIAAALEAWFRAHGASADPGVSEANAWRRAGRLDSLR